MLDVLILTHNESLNLPYALRSVQGLARQVFVVDSGSTDATAAISQAMGATLVRQPWLGYAAQKNWALDNLPMQSPWVLILDADESLTEALADEIRRVVSQPVDSVRESAFFLNRVLIFMGGEIRHCGYFPSWNLRLFKRGMARYEERAVHEHMVVQGSSGYLKQLIRHEDRRGLENYIAKHNRYSTLEAREIFHHREPWPGWHRFVADRVARRRFIKYRMNAKLATPWLWRFVYMYFICGGFLDRQAGLSFCLFISSYELFIRLKFQDFSRMRGTGLSEVAGLAIPEGANRSTLPAPSISGSELARAIPTMAAETPSSEIISSTSAKLALPGRRSRHGEIMRQASQWTFSQKVRRVLWTMTQGTFFRFSPHNAYGWRAFLLRRFGATLGENVRIRSTVEVEIPWNLTIGDHGIVGDHAVLYCLGNVTLGRFVTISQYAHLCAGTHEADTRRMALIVAPITLGDDVWIAADAFVGPGVTIGPRTLLGARSSAFRDLPPDVIAVGNPAKPLRPRNFRIGD